MEASHKRSSISAMQMALEALERYGGVDQRACDAEEALRQALETEREWVGLTADEIWQCNKASGSAVEFHICYEHQNVLDFAESIEEKLKEKNT